MKEMHKIKCEINSMNIEEWLHYVCSCRYSTYFHNPQWYKIWRKYQGGSFDYYCLKVSFEGNSGLFPYMLDSKNNIARSGYKGYGGLLCNSKVDIDTKIYIYRKIAETVKGLHIRENPIGLDKIEKKDLVQLQNWTEDYTHIIEIDQFDESKWRNSTKRRLKQLEQIFQTVDSTAESDWNHFFDIYQETVQRWGQKAKKIYKKEVFDLLFRSCGEGINLRLVKDGSKIIAGAIFLRQNFHVHYWLSAVKQDYVGYSPIILLIHDELTKLKNSTVQYFDMGVSGRNEDLIFFKSGFRPVEAPSFVYKNYIGESRFNHPQIN